MVAGVLLQAFARRGFEMFADRAPGSGRSAWVFSVASTTCIPCAFVGVQPKHDLPLWFCNVLRSKFFGNFGDCGDSRADRHSQLSAGNNWSCWSSELLFSFWGLKRGLDLVYRHVTRIKLMKGIGRVKCCSCVMVFLWWWKQDQWVAVVFAHVAQQRWRKEIARRKAGELGELGWEHIIVTSLWVGYVIRRHTSSHVVPSSCHKLSVVVRSCHSTLDVSIGCTLDVSWNMWVQTSVPFRALCLNAQGHSALRPSFLTLVHDETTGFFFLETTLTKGYSNRRRLILCPGLLTWWWWGVPVILHLHQFASCDVAERALHSSSQPP